jgi:hypothetical protein
MTSTAAKTARAACPDLGRTLRATSMMTGGKCEGDDECMAESVEIN